MDKTTLAKRAWLLFFLVAIAFYFYGLNQLPLVGPDEPRYAEVAREMLVRGDAVTPTLGGHNWFEKPALLYWMMMVSYRAFGVSEWSARCGSALSGLLTVLLVYWVARRTERLSGAEESGLGLWSALSLASSAGLIVFSRGATFDIVLTMTVTAALACFFVFEIETGEKRRRWLLAGFYLGVGASLLAKGLVGIIIPLGTVAFYLILKRSWPGRQLIFSLLWGLPLALLVAATWYGPMINRHGWVFIDQFFIQHHFARYVSDKYRHPQPFYFYLPVLLLFALPWTPFLISALLKLKRGDRREPVAIERLRLFSLAWLVMPVAFFSLSGSKLPGYVLPALPGAALLSGEMLASYTRGAGSLKAMRATGALLLLSALLLLVQAKRTGDASLACILTVAGPLLIAGAASVGWTSRRKLCATLAALAVFASTALAVNCAAGRIAGRASVRDLLRQAAARGYASAPVYHMHTRERTTEFYAAGRVVYDAQGEPVSFDGPSPVEEIVRHRESFVLVIIPVEFAYQLTGNAALQAEIIGDNGSVALIAVRAR